MFQSAWAHRNNNNKGEQHVYVEPVGARGSQGFWGRSWLAVAIGLASGAASAGPTLELGEDTTLESSLTVNYTASMRTAKQANQYLNDINNDDGTRNFKRGSLITNRVSLFGELRLRHDNVGAVLRGSHFYDDVYHQRNDNDSPQTVNKVGRSDGFVEDTRRLSGSRARLLDAYVYGNYQLGDTQYLSLKAGRHLVAWGESLFWANISQGQAPVDATKFNVPGTEAKDAYLPVGQVSASWSLNEDLALVGFYQYEWEKTQLNPVGDYFGSDTFGPGAEFFRLNAGVIESLPDKSFTGVNYAGEVKPGTAASGAWVCAIASPKTPRSACSTTATTSGLVHCSSTSPGRPSTRRIRGSASVPTPALRRLTAWATSRMSS
ncbi:hypothetical protein PspTeo4_13800 [Pseudomonas sp. Teo4]|nr:hypothetical protein [Pseudomonas sp. Teo4]